MATLTTSWKSYASASFSTGPATIAFYLEARYTSQSIANNTTNVQTRLRSAYTKGGSTSGAGYKFTCTYASTVSGSGTWTFENEVITSGSKTITHKTDGTQTVSLKATAYNKYWNFNKSMSATVTLPSIPRKATVTAAPNFTDEDNPTISYSNPAGNNVTTLQASIYMPDAVTGLAYYRDIPKTGTSYTFNLTEEERQRLRLNCLNSKSTTVRFYVRTVLGGTNYTSFLARTLTIANANPTFAAAYQDTNPDTIAITGNNQQIIRNQSTLQIDITNAEAKKDATLQSLSVNINGNIYTGTISGTTGTINVGTIDVSGNITATVTLTDSRGNSTSQNLPLEVLDWTLPTANITLERQNNFYSETDITVDANYSSLDGNNTIDIKVRTKKTTDSTYGSYTSLSDNVTTTLNLDNLYEWDVQVLITDRLGSTTYNLTIGKGMPIIYFDRLKRSVGVDCFPNDEESLEVAYETEQYNIGKIINERSAITCTTGSSNRTINVTSTWTSYKQTLTTLLNKTGDTFTLTNNEILVNEDCYALVSKNGLMRGPSTSQPSVTRITLYRNNTAIQLADSYVYNANVNYWCGNNISPILWELKAGDIIRSELLSGATGSVGFAGNTCVTVQRIK